MSGTPRLRSAFPSSPSSEKINNEGVVLASGAWNLNSTSSSVSSNQNFVTPLVPCTVVDPPSQRLYIAFLYLGLMLWRLYDYFNLVSNETDSLWLFMKWVAIDSVFLYGLPALRIPWLQWSPGTTTLVFVGHASLNAILMFRIPVCYFLSISFSFVDHEAYRFPSNHGLSL